MAKWKTGAIWVVLIAGFLVLFQLSGRGAEWAGFEAFEGDADSGRISELHIQDNQLLVSTTDGREYRTLGLLDEEELQSLSEAGVQIHWGEPKNLLRTLLTIGLPLVLLLGLIVFFLRRSTSGGMNIMELKKSRARLVDDSAKAHFEDVGGCEEAKRQLADVVDFLREPERWAKANVRLPRGILLEGPPGCGKTLLARAVAGETDAAFYFVSGSEFVELFVGAGAARMRDMFDVARKNLPAVIFIDELDAIGRRRGSGIGPAHEEREQTLNQLLVNLDGFDRNDRIVVIAATNRPDVLDNALVRPGRFDRRIQVPALELVERVQVLRVHTRGMQLAEDVDLEELAAQAEGASGAQLESLVNEAGLLAVRRAGSEPGGAVRITRADFVAAEDPRRLEAGFFDQVDGMLLESTSQLARSPGRAMVCVSLTDGTRVVGELVWADASFLKVRAAEDGGVLVAKSQVKTIQALAGTEELDPEDLNRDAWAGRPLDVA